MEDRTYYFETLRNTKLCTEYEKDFIRGIVIASTEENAIRKLENTYGKINYRDLDNSKILEHRVYNHSVIEF